MKIPRLTYAFLAIALSCGPGCIKMFKGKVSNGVARLSVRNFATMAQLIHSDTECGFSSPDVLNNAEIDGNIGDYGSATFRVSSCTVSFSKLTELSKDCNGAASYAKGSFTVSGTKTITGRLTGDTSSPVVPDSAEAATLHIDEATFNDFHVEVSSSDNSLTQIEGAISGTMFIRLADSASTGACSIPTAMAGFQQLTYATSSKVHVYTSSRDFDVDVDGGSINAQNGKWTSNGVTRENYIAGTLKVWGSENEINDDDHALDPDYDTSTFNKGWRCTDDLALPISYSCDIEPTIAGGAARLSIRTLGALAGLINDDTTCGFASAAATASTVNTGTVGNKGGSNTVTVKGCTLNFPNRTVVSTDCQGNSVYVQGSAIVNASKTIRGYRTGSVDQPVVPTSSTPAHIAIDAQLSKFIITTDGSVQSLTLTGPLSGSVTPHTAIDTETGACSIATPVAKFDNVRITDAEARVVSEAMQFDVHIDSAALTATNGRTTTHTNFIEGSVALSGRVFDIGAADNRLDPDYTPVAFDAAYQCEANMKVPSTKADCSFTPVLAQGAARLLIKAFGVAVMRAENNASCGFSSLGSYLPTGIAPTPGDVMNVVFDINHCTVGDPITRVLATEYCDKTALYLHGTADIIASKTVNGVLAPDFPAAFPPIHPIDRRGVHIDIHQATLNNFKVTEFLPGSTQSESYMTIHNGVISGTSTPILGEATSAPGRYFIANLVTQFNNIVARNMDVTIVVDGMQFKLRIDRAALEAFNGSYENTENRLTGSMVADGQFFDIPIDANKPVLNPNYDQARFDSLYVCLDNLLETVPIAFSSQRP